MFENFTEEDFRRSAPYCTRCWFLMFCLQTTHQLEKQCYASALQEHRKFCYFY